MRGLMSWANDSRVITGASADTNVGAGPVNLDFIDVDVPGAEGYSITVYDGPVVGGTLVRTIDATVVGNLGKHIHFERAIRSSSGLHIVTVDSGGNMKIYVAYLPAM